MVPTSADRAAGRRRIGAWLSLIILPLALHWPHLSGWLSENPAWLLSGLSQGSPAGSGVLTGYPGWIDGNAGVTTQALGGLAARDWLGGIVPWWNPDSGVGLPLAAEMQNSAFFLPFVLLLRCFDGVVYLKIALQIVAGLSTWLLLTEIELAPGAAFIGAACFELNGSFAWFAHGPIMPIAFLPLLLFGIERARRQQPQGAFWIAISIAWSLLAGFPETAYLDGLLGLGWAVLRTAQARQAWPALASWPVLASWIVAGGSAGLLLATPPLLAFAESLPLSFLGNHIDFRSAILPPPARASLLFPYIFGPPMYGGLHLSGAASLAQFIAWYKTAGYLDLPLLCLALLAVPIGEPRSHAGLRWLLTGWVLCALGRAIGIPVLSLFIDLVPMVRNTMFSLYIVPSCQLAVLILAALAVDDWIRCKQRPPWPAACIASILAAASLPGAWTAARTLQSIPNYPWFPFLSVTGALGCVLAATMLLARPATLRRLQALGSLLVGEAALLFFLPLLAGTPAPRRIDHAAIAFLRAQSDLSRIHSVGTLTPNYGAWFGIAAIDHNYLPVPQAWVDDVRGALFAHADAINNFFVDSGPDGIAALRARLPALAARGVRFVVVPAGAPSLGAHVAVQTRPDRNEALALTSALDGGVSPEHVAGGRLAAIDLRIGTYGGAARGTLTVSICQSGRCAQGQAALALVADNTVLSISLASPLDLQAGHALTYRIAASAAATRPPALWLAVPTDPAEAAHGGLAPQLTFELAPALGAPQSVYRDATVAIYRLDETPYFRADDCRVTATTRMSAETVCVRPARLTRLELAYPGWRAWRDGVPVPIERNGIFQSVQVPGGRSRLRFAYAPSGAIYAWLAAALGMAATAWFAWRGLSSGRRAITGRSTKRLIT